MSQRRLPSIAVLAILVLVAGSGCTAFKPGKPGPTTGTTSTAGAVIGTPDPSTCGIHGDVSGPPCSTPLAQPPAVPAGDGTRVTLSTELGDVVIDVYNLSSPVAAENFVNLASTHFYDGIVFHRVIADFVVQGGDPEGTGSGGPGWTIRDEPIVGDYLRGTVAMARTSAPESEGSQFFICLADGVLEASGRYAIFGTVVSGMDVVDAIAARPNVPGSNPQDGEPVDPVVINGTTVTQP